MPLQQYTYAPFLLFILATFSWTAVFCSFESPKHLFLFLLFSCSLQFFTANIHYHNHYEYLMYNKRNEQPVWAYFKGVKDVMPVALGLWAQSGKSLKPMLHVHAQ